MCSSPRYFYKGQRHGRGLYISEAIGEAARGIEGKSAHFRQLQLPQITGELFSSLKLRAALGGESEPSLHSAVRPAKTSEAGNSDSPANNPRADESNTFSNNLPYSGGPGVDLPIRFIMSGVWTHDLATHFIDASSGKAQTKGKRRKLASTVGSQGEEVKDAIPAPDDEFWLKLHASSSMDAVDTSSTTDLKASECGINGGWKLAKNETMIPFKEKVSFYVEQASGPPSFLYSLSFCRSFNAKRLELAAC